MEAVYEEDWTDFTLSLSLYNVSRKNSFPLRPSKTTTRQEDCMNTTLAVSPTLH